VGLVLGWRERTGPLVWQAPHGVSFTIRQLGSLLFLGMAGTSGGAALRAAVEDGGAWKSFVGGVLITTLSAVVLIAIDHFYFGGMRMPPSTRMTSPFMYGLVMSSITIEASSSAAPRRFGNSTDWPRCALNWSDASPVP
jgi:uncharacterized transporter YbjL